MTALNFIKEMFRKFPWMLINTTLLLLAVGVLGAGSLFTIGPLVDFVMHPDLKDLSPLTLKAIKVLEFFNLPVRIESWIVILMIFVTLTSIFQIFARHSIYKMKYVVLRDLMMGAFTDFFNARWYFFTSGKQGVFLNTLSRELSAVVDAFSSMALLFAGFIQLAFYLAVPFSISWKVTLLNMFIAAIFVIPFGFLGRLSYRWGLANTSTGNHLTSVILECLSLVKIILGFGNQKQSIQKLDQAWADHAQATIRSQSMNISIPILYRPFGVTMVVIAMFTAQHLNVPISDMSVLLMALLQVAWTIGEIIRNKNALENFYPSYEQIEYLRERARQMKQVSGSKEFKGFNRTLELRNLTFAYPNHAPVLQEINVTIAKGSMVAFVGKSGSGKSTMIDLIMGFHQPTQGSIAIDGIALKDYDIISYRNNIGYVPQDSVLFNMTIRDNLLWANPSASPEEIKNVCRLAYVDEFISQMPLGLDTVVGDRGIRLSGGQIQRIALARALLRSPSFLILDEATSSLDTHSERLIQKAVENIARETTVIVVAHRLSTIKTADCIYVLSNGRVAEQGTYLDLIKKEGTFSAMVQLQELEATAAS